MPCMLIKKNFYEYAVVAMIFDSQFRIEGVTDALDKKEESMWQANKGHVATSQQWPCGKPSRS